MATVRMTLAAAGLMVCGLAFANGMAAATTVAATADAAAIAATAAEPDSPRAPSVSKSKAAKAKAAAAGIGTKKTAKASTVTKAASRARSPGSGRMQVEEPRSAAPMSPGRESKAWQKSHSRGLTDAQKKAFRERKENMEGMIAVIKEKRKALRDAKPEERAALALELHRLILENDPVVNSQSSSASSAARTGTVAPENPRADKPAPEAKNPGQPAQREDAKKAESAEAAEFRRKRVEAYQEQMRRKEELRKQQIEKFKSGLDNSLAPVGGLSQGNEAD